MKWIVLTLILLAAPAAFAQPAGFPFDRQFQADGLNGDDVTERGITLTIRKEGNSGGRAGCNSWNAQVQVTDKALQVGSIATTRMFCGDSVMNIEADFLAVLKSNPAWRMDGGKLILTGGPGEISMIPSAAKK